MNDPLPSFDQIPPQEVPAPPKKPKPKPTRKRRARKAVKVASPAKIKRKKRRATKVKPTPAKEEVFLSPEVYKTIRTLVDLDPSERSMVLAIVSGLTG